MAKSSGWCRPPQPSEARHHIGRDFPFVEGGSPFYGDAPQRSGQCRMRDDVADRRCSARRKKLLRGRLVFGDTASIPCPVKSNPRRYDEPLLRRVDRRCEHFFETF